MSENGQMTVTEMTSRAELDALPAESVVRDKFGTVLERHLTEQGELVWLSIGSPEVWDGCDIDLPALLLYKP